MKKTYFLFILFSTSTILYSNAQVGEWKWIHGDSASHPYNNTGTFGTQGVPSATNEPPAFYEACEWKDLNGNFWLFGGNSTNSQWHGDLWKYDPLANEWTWMKGPGIASHN